MAVVNRLLYSVKFNGGWCGFAGDTGGGSTGGIIIIAVKLWVNKLLREPSKIPYQNLAVVGVESSAILSFWSSLYSLLELWEGGNR